MVEAQLTSEFGISAQQAKRLKAEWRLQGVAEAARSRLPSLDDLQQLWSDRPDATWVVAAELFGISARHLRLHSKRLGFEPVEHSPDAAVVAALQQIQLHS